MFRISLIIFLLFSMCLSQQISNPKADSINEGAKTILNSREVIGLEKTQIKSLNYKVKTSILVNTSDGNSIPDFVSEVSLLFPDKIQSISSISGNTPYKSTKTWNGEKYKSFYELEIAGQRIVKEDTNNKTEESLKSTDKVLGKDKANIFKDLKRQDPEVVLIESMWTELFPLILRHPFELNVEFKYVGKAQSNGKTADVVDFVLKNGKNYRLLFDSETNLLLMMVVSYKRDDQFFTGNQEEKYYFSNREKVDGVLIPKTIKVENKRTAKDKDPIITFQQIDVLEFKINPEFKKDLFDIK